MSRSLFVASFVFVVTVVVGAASVNAASLKHQRQSRNAHVAFNLTEFLHHAASTQERDQARAADPTQCSSNYMPLSQCRQLGAVCWFAQPYLCFSASGAEQGCYSPEQAAGMRCAGGCYDTRRCATGHCDEQCPPTVAGGSFCGLAWQNSWACPQPGSGLPDDVYIAASGADAGRCGTANDLINDTGVSRCCNFVRSCLLIGTQGSCNRSCDNDTCRVAANKGTSCSSVPGNRFLVSAAWDGNVGWCGANMSDLGGSDPYSLLSNPDVRGCCDARSCEVARCETLCSASFCATAAANGWTCSEPDRPFIVSKSESIRGWCGMDATCTDKTKCWRDNINVQSCCDFSSCARPPGNTCAGVQCPPWACHITPGQERCPINMFECIAGKSQFGCNTSPTHWTNPENQCTSCCDVSTCAITCSATCPPDVQASLCAGRCSAANPFVCSAGTISGIVGACSSNPTNWEYSPFCTSCCQCAV